MSGSSALTRRAMPYLAWRYAGERAWREEHPARLSNLRRGQDGIVSFDAVFTDVLVNIQIQAVADNAWQIAGSLRHAGRKNIELARFHYFDGPLAGESSFLELQGSAGFPRLISRGRSLPSPRSDVEQLWAGMQVFWSALSEPIHDAADWSVSRDTGVFTSAWDKPGWGFGFTGPGTAFGEIGFRTRGTPARFFVGELLDNILLEPGESRQLEHALIWYGDWQTGLRQWARATATEFRAPAAKPPMVGYCSWYQRGQDVEPADILRAVHEFAAWPSPPGGRTIQIDDGWEILPGDWRPKAKFATVWKDLPDIIRQSGALPGGYVAPTAVQESSTVAREHPDWLQKLPDGRDAVSFSNWGGKTYFLDPDRPPARDYLRSLFVQFREEGWDYVKIDFTYGLSTARVAYNRKRTSFESMRDMYAAFREGAGPRMLLSACVGEPGRYALGLVDVARLGGDTGANWKTVKGNLAQMLTLTSTNGAWWQGDPDVFYMREKSGLNEEESYLLTGTLGLLGGLFLTSDYPSQWSDQRAAMVRDFWTAERPKVPFDHRVLWSPDGDPLAYRVTYGEGAEAWHRVALYNWTDQPRNIRIRLQDVAVDGGAWRLGATIGNRALRLENGCVVSERQPPHSLRIANLLR